MAYALARRVEYFDQPAIRDIVREAEENEYRISSFILGVVTSDQFRLRTAASGDGKPVRDRSSVTRMRRHRWPRES